MGEYSSKYSLKEKGGRIQKTWMKHLLSTSLGLRVGRFQLVDRLFLCRCYFCPELSKALKTMKKGEKVMLKVKPQYAFGEYGREACGDEAAVPPNSTPQIALELVSCKIVSDVTSDKKVLKKILKEGEGYERPNDGAVVQAATIWMIPFGLSCAVSTRVSNELGAGHPRAARNVVLVVLFLAVTEGALVGLVLILLRNVWGYAYSNEVEVVRYAGAMIPILAISNFADGIECVLSGIVRFCGWQKIGAFINLGSYYLVGMPSAVLLAFVLHIGGKGLWLGIVCALIVQMVSLLTITMRTNWEIEAKRATERVYESTIPVDGVS